MFEVLCASIPSTKVHEWLREMQRIGWKNGPDSPSLLSRGKFEGIFHKNSLEFPIFTHTNIRNDLFCFLSPTCWALFLFFSIPISSDIFIYLQFFILLCRFDAVKSSSGTDKTDYWMSNLQFNTDWDGKQEWKKLDIKWFWRMLNEEKKVYTYKKIGVVGWMMKNDDEWESQRGFLTQLSNDARQTE